MNNREKENAPTSRLRRGPGPFKPLLLLGMASLLTASAGEAQRLFDQERNDQAQAAKGKLGALGTGTLFKRQLDNVDVLIKNDFELYFLESQRQVRSDVAAFNSWNDLDRVVQRHIDAVGSLDQFSEYDMTQLAKDLGQRMAEAKSALEALQIQEKGSGDPTFERLLEQIGDLGSLQQYAERLLKLLGTKPTAPEADSEDHPVRATGASLKELVATFDVLGKVYKDYKKRLDEIRKLEGQLPDLKLTLAKVALRQLKLEEEYYKNIGAIRARREAEEKEVQGIITQYQKAVQTIQQAPYNVSFSRPRIPDSTPTTVPAAIALLKSTSIEETLARIADEPDIITDSTGKIYVDSRGTPLTRRKRLANLALVLHNGAAIISRASRPADLAGLRLDQEAHLYSIRRSAVLAETYELVITNAVERLALYHQGGLKPAEVAQFIHAIATVAIPPSILAK